MWCFDDINFPKGHTAHLVDAIEHNDDLYTCCLGLSITKWNKTTASPVTKLQSHEAPIMKLIIHDDHLFSCSWDKTVKIWDLKTNACIKTLHHTVPLYALYGSNHKIYAGDANGNVLYCYYKKQNNFRLLHTMHSPYIISHIFVYQFKTGASTHKHLYSVDNQGLIVKWDVKTNEAAFNVSESYRINGLVIVENMLYCAIGNLIKIRNLHAIDLYCVTMITNVCIKSLFVKDNNVYAIQHGSPTILYWSSATVNKCLNAGCDKIHSIDGKLTRRSGKVVMNMIQTKSGMCISYSDGSVSLWIPRTCLMCCEIMMSTDAQNCDSCQAHICRPCMAKWMNMNKVGHCVLPTNFKCPMCKRTATYRMFNKVYNKSVVRQMSFCSFDDESYYAWCEKCYKVEAFMEKKCSEEMPAITNYRCDECVTKKAKKLMDSAKTCVKCNHSISKVSGCNHIKCVCGAHWCYVCGASFEKSSECCSHLRSVHGSLF